jgi:hypothetical protein
MKVFPPDNFTYHNENVAFSAYPDVENVRFLRDLGFRKFLNLCQTWPKHHEALLGKELQLEVRHYPLSVGSYSFEPIDEERLRAILDFIVETHRKGSRIYMYDASGCNQVALVSSVLRKIEGWDDVAVLSYYDRIAGSFSTSFARRFLYDFDVSRWSKSYSR